jgi:hypothetical protein
MQRTWTAPLFEEGNLGSEIGTYWEQDEDDPSQVTVDEASVTAAVKELAKTKKHFIQSEDGGQQQRQRQAPKSGSSFGGSGNQNKQTAEQQALVAKYPALRRVR